MRTDLAYAAVGTVAAVAPEAFIYNAGGVLVPVVPAIIGMISALMVRIAVVTSPSRKSRFFSAYNISITILTMLGAAVYISDNQLTGGQSFGAGVGCGALGVGIIELGRSQFATAFKAAMQTLLQGMAKGAGDRSEPPGPDKSA